jgi:hypothetical protein
MCLPFDDLAKRTLGKGEHRGFAWEIVKTQWRTRCGYVRVGPAHPWFGKDHDDIPADVHGGLTFAKGGRACETHDDKAEWWIGFDCGHAGDAPDPSLIEPGEYLMPSYYGGDVVRGDVVRTQEYVELECRLLCEQAAKVAVG